MIDRTQPQGGPRPERGHLPLPDGAHIREYVIDRVLGNGGFGITYLAHHETLGRRVAIKEHFPREFAYRTGVTIQPTGVDDDIYEWTRAKFIEEARTLARFDHPAIVKVLDVFEANGTAYMVQGFEAGRSLGAWLDTLGRVPSQEELDTIVPPLLDALETIHGEGLLHRDIAPDNIIIRTNGRPCLIDFGAARGYLGSRTQTVAIVKPGFSPPEQYNADARLQGPWSDIYALGATLFRAVTGDAPEVAPQRSLHEPGSMPTAVDLAKGDYRRALLKGIDAAMIPRPKSRPQSIAEWRDMLGYGASNDDPQRLPEAPSPTREGSPRHLPGTSVPPAGGRARAEPTGRAGASQSEPVSRSGAAPAAPASRPLLLRTTVIAAVILVLAGGGFLARNTFLGVRPTDCDRLASSPTDDKRVTPGVDWDGLDGPAAINACVRDLAAATDRTISRLQLQLGRGYERQARFEEAARAYRSAATAGYVEAQNRMGDLLYGGLGVARDLVAACRLFQSAAEAGNADAMSSVAACYSRGLGVTPRDQAKAIEWAQKSAARGYPDGIATVAASFGEQVLKDPKEIVRKLAEASAKGSWQATYYLAEQYETGSPAIRDEVRARQLYAEAIGPIRRFADANRGVAHYLLGLMQYYGRGTPVDHAAAARSLRTATELGAHFAFAWLGALYENGEGVKQDFTEARRLYEAGVERGESGALQNLALLYRDGKGVAKDAATARQLLQKAIDSGVDSALSELAFMYEQGTGGVQDYAEAMRLYRLAAGRNVSIAFNNIGDLFEHGKGVPIDLTEAVGWYRRGAERGEPSALESLGLAYENGKGVAQDYTEAARWYREAAQRGNASAMQRIGRAYREGNGVPQDFAEALKWLNQAIAKGDLEAYNMVGVMHDNGDGVPVNSAEAIRLHRIAADKGNAQAMFYIARHYENGRGVPKNCAIATQWYQKSAQGGDEDAKNKLADGSLSRCR